MKGGVGRLESAQKEFPADRSEGPTAAAVWARILAGADPTVSKVIQRGAELCARCPPAWNPTDGSIDLCYWYFGSLALRNVGGTRWSQWRRPMVQALVAGQRGDTDVCAYRGSWDPIGAWGAAGGRIYATAISLLTLQTAQRFPSRR